VGDAAERGDRLGAGGAAERRHHHALVPRREEEHAPEIGDLREPLAKRAKVAVHWW
jgi:hypothetical protein